MTFLAAINWHSIAFLFFALVACGFGIAVVMTANIVRMAFYLTLSLGATSGLFFLAGAEFVVKAANIMLVGGLLLAFIELYGMTLLMRMLGIFYRMNQARLGWMAD